MSREPACRYSPITERPFDLPDGQRVGVWVIPNIEHYVFDMAYPNDQTEYVPDVRNYSWRDYGKRVGIWRLMEVLDEFDIRATVALNSDICEHAPAIVEAGMDRGWEFMGHGQTNSVRLADLGETEERRVIEETRDRISAFTGNPPNGWLGPGLTETFATPRLLAEAGFGYVCDWVNDDQPYRMDVDGSMLVSIPYSGEINDIPMIMRRNMSGPEFERTIRDQFDVLYREGGRDGQAKIMAIALHPHITGHPHRSVYLSNALAYITAHDDVWLCTGSEIVDHYVSAYL